MGPVEWDQIFNLFHAAREKSSGDRVLLLDRTCGENTPLRKAVEELLKEDEAASGFLSEPLFGSRAGERRGTRVAPGQRLGRYVTVAPVGCGGMGEVWSAHDTDLDRLVALKFLSSEALTLRDSDQITREAKAASALNHPGIVTIYEVVHSDSTLAIAMELVEGRPLRELCGKPVQPSEVMAIGAQIAEALAAAHGCGTIHGDIKPENILLRRDRYVKVLDFGLARKITTETIAYGGISGLGTLRYVSPEQARGERLTPASDIFSFGLVLYELATGRHAFPEASSLDTARAILVKEASLPSSLNPAVPARLDSLIRAMLMKQAVARPPAKEVARSLRQLQSKGTSPAIFPGWKWILAAVVLIVACFAAWHWKQILDRRNAFSFRQITTLVPENRATAAAISPDGNWAAYANVDGIFIRGLPNAQTRALRSPSDFMVDRLAWFTDGTRLLASGFSALTSVRQIWSVSMTGALPHLLRGHAREGSPSPDGTHIVFVSQDRSEIWAMGANGEDPWRIEASRGQDTFPLVFWSPDGRRIAFQRRHYAPGRPRPNISGTVGQFDIYYERSYESVSLARSRTLARVPDMWMQSAAALPDGRVLFLRWDPPGSDSRQLWEVHTDIATGAFLETPRKVANPVDQNAQVHITDMSASSDGKQVLVLRKSDQNAVFVGDFNTPPRISNVRRLILDERANYPHAWTRDGRAVIFESDRNGNYDLFKQNIDKRTPETIVATALTEVLPQLGPNGHWVLYDARAPNANHWERKLMRVPVEGGTAEEVPIGGWLDEFRCAINPGKGCVLRSAIREEYYVYYDLDPIRGKGRELARTKWVPAIFGDWDVSPDKTEVAIPNHDSRSARIRVISLQQGSKPSSERELVLEGWTNLSGLHWAADGKGWFVSVDTTVGNQLLYVWSDGRIDPLGNIHGWAVPSPDGRRVAFLDDTFATNAWLMDRR